jgi:hypothetical protein
LIGERLTAAWIVALELTTVWRRPELLLGREGRRLLLIETASAAAALVASTVIVGTGWGNARTARITVNGLRRVAPHVVLLRSELNGQRSRHTTWVVVIDLSKDICVSLTVEALGRPTTTNGSGLGNRGG